MEDVVGGVPVEVSTVGRIRYAMLRWLRVFPGIARRGLEARLGLPP
jgi:hypothetical protein